ncbi:MAG: aminotransferase class I/II-fold pyridoxal phosphate-dependent enzyme [Xanthomonadales bacterium]|nr:aminotransferase class I/II-fold pyridoxal phosphate-dependent enzyme [Xanthomonadales bacterium]
MSELPPANSANPFEFEAESMRRLGYRVVDRIVEHMLSAEQVPPVRWNQVPGDVKPLIQPFPEAPRDPAAAVEEAIDTVFGNTTNLMHPRFFAYMPGPSNYISALADFMASGFNVFAGVTPHNFSAFEVERQTIDWLGAQFGWSEPSSGLFVSGGSAANFTALAVARQVQLENRMDGAVVYCSEQTHSSIERAMYLLGFKPRQLRLLEPDVDLRLEAGVLQQAVVSDLAAGLRPFCVIGNGGTTNTGTVDPLDDLADVCERHDLWFHVDAAYGGGAILSPTTRERFAGIERAHTITVDPHKWMFQPFECACILGREQAWFRDTFRRLPAYMRDTDAGGDSFNYRDMGLQVTRSFKAFKLWLSLQVYGVETFRTAVDRGLALARYAERRVRSMAAWEVVTPATLGVLTCRYRGQGEEEDLDQLNAGLARALNRSGFAYVTTTELFGFTVLRLCPIHPGTTEADIDETLRRLDAFAREDARGETASADRS